MAKLDGVTYFGWCGISPKATEQLNILGPLGFQGYKCSIPGGTIKIIPISIVPMMGQRDGNCIIGYG